MTTPTPRLDDRTFDDIVAAARERLRRFLPEWTDHNPSDPGAALVDLFAWLTQDLIYKINRVPDRDLLTFLGVLGLERGAPRPSTAPLAVTASRPGPPTAFPAGTQVAAPGPDGTQIVFETVAGLDVLTLPLASVVVDDGVPRDRTEENRVGGPTFAPLGWSPQPGNALYLGFALPPGAGTGELPAVLALHAFAPPRPVAAFRSTEADRRPAPPVELVWECRSATDPTRWRRLDLLDDASVALTRDGTVLVEGPGTAPATKEAGVGEPRCWVRCRLRSGTYPTVPALEALLANVVTVRQTTTVRDELAGVTEGHPGETFTLRRTPVQPHTLALDIVGRSGTTRYVEVDDLLSSGPDDPHMTVDPVTGTLRFGDGERGRVPEGGADVVARTYRSGGGAAGNVPAGAIATVLGSRPGLEVTNARAATGGDDPPDTAQLRRDAPALLRTRQRGVTAADLADLARGLDGVADAIALPLAHPDHPGVQVPGTVTVVVVPDTAGPDGTPRPTNDLLAAVGTALDEVRMLTTELYVRGPTFRRVDVAVRVRTDPAAGVATSLVHTALDDALAPLRPGPDGVPRASFGRALFPSSLFGPVLAVPGVLAVERLALRVDGLPHDELGEPVALEPGGLTIGGDHDVDVVVEDGR